MSGGIGSPEGLFLEIAQIDADGQLAVSGLSMTSSTDRLI